MSVTRFEPIIDGSAVKMVPEENGLWVKVTDCESSVKVKSLEWNKYDEAHTSLVNYYLLTCREEDGEWKFSVICGKRGRVALGNTRSEAKIKAQEDFEKCILDSLE